MTKPKVNPPEPLEVDMKPSTYQPTKAEMEEEIDMPAWSRDQVCETFIRPLVSR